MLYLPGVPEAHVRERLLRAGGNELRSGKSASPQSSAALAANTFGWFATRPELLPAVPGVEAAWPPLSVEIEYCARFPWRGGRHPWLDAGVLTASELIGVESKRYEPFRSKPAAGLSPAYDRPVWGERMAPYEAMRDALRREPRRFRRLDAVQLVKHAFGLVTEARRLGRAPVLLYLYAEPEEAEGALLRAHREEVETFAEAVAGAEVAFRAISYRAWLATWTGPAAAHAAAILAAFRP